MKKVTTIVLAGILSASVLAGCGSGNGSAAASSAAEVASTAVSSVSEAVSEAVSAVSEAASQAEAALPDGVYTAEFTTDSTMFHINEALDNKGTLTVENGQMTIHITLASKSIVNLYPGLAEDAQKAGAVLLEPTEDEVTYSDGMTETAYGFDVPVPALDEEFDVAIIGTKGNWYDHKVMVSNPVKAE